jgi:OmpA-OmpF porin, OOP family
MKLKFKTMSAVASASALVISALSISANAQSIDGDIYVGGALSYNKVANLGGNIDAALASGGTTSSSSADSSKLGTGFKLGYRFNPNIALEGTYDRIGTMNVQSTLTAPTADTASGQWSAKGYGAHLLLIAPLDHEWSINGRVGMENWKTSVSLNSNTGGTTAISNSNNHVGVVLGGGLSYAVSKNVDATGEYAHYYGVGNSASTGQTGVNSFALGLRYHFL